MARLSVAVDEGLVEEVRRLSGSRTKREAFTVALTEYVRRKRLEQLASLAGSGLVDLTAEELERWRAGAGGEDES
jgi:Arc/MetJ family transcription regulator